MTALFCFENTCIVNLCCNKRNANGATIILSDISLFSGCMQAMESESRNHICFEIVNRTLMTMTATVQHCNRCLYKGPTHTFPLKKNGSGYTKACLACNNKKAGAKENVVKSVSSKLPPSTLALEDCLNLVSLSKNSPFELDTFVVLPQENGVETGTIHNIANTLRDGFRLPLEVS